MASILGTTFDFVVKVTDSTSGTPLTDTLPVTWTIGTAPSLAALGGTFTLPEDALQGDAAGNLTGVTSGSTLSLQDSAGGRVELVGNQVRRGATALDYETATSHAFTIRETLAGAVGSPKDTVLSLTVTDVAEGGAVPTVSPSAAWVTAGGVEESGWAGGTSPYAVTTSKPNTGTDRANAATPKPAIVPFFADHRRFTDRQRVYFGSGAKNSDGTILNTLGVEKITVHYEGTDLDLTNCQFHTYTDINGTVRTVYGWAVDLVHNGNGVAKLWFTAVPRDVAKASRTVGPYFYYPSTGATPVLDIAPSQAPVSGSQYQTIDAAWEYAQGQGYQSCRVLLKEPGHYLIESGVSMFANAGVYIIQANVPGCSVGGTPGTSYTGPTLPFTVDYRAGALLATLRPQNVEFRGANLTFDMRWIREIGGGSRNHNVFFNGCNMTNSGGTATRWAGADAYAGKLVGNTGLCYIRDVPTGTYLQNPGKEANAIVNCNFYDGSNDFATGCHLIYGNTVDIWGTHNYKYVNAFKLYKTGGGTPTIDYASNATLGGRDIVFKLNAVEVGRYNIQSGEGNFDPYWEAAWNANLHGGTGIYRGYRISHVVDYVNNVLGGSGWVATLDNDSTRAQYFSKINLDVNGKYIGGGNGGPTNGNGLFTGYAVGTSPGTATQLATYIDQHADFRAGQNRNENAFVAFNKCTRLRGVQTVFNSIGGGTRDQIWVNNIFETDPPGIPLTNPYDAQITTTTSHIALFHNTWTDQRNKWTGSRDAASAFSANAIYTFSGTKPTSGQFSSNHAQTGSFPNPAFTDHSVGGSKASLFVDAAGGVFTPAGALLTNLKPRFFEYDINGNERAALDAAGAVRKV